MGFKLLFFISILFRVSVSQAGESSSCRFAAMGDVPYSPQEYQTLKRQIDDLNGQAQIEFVIHLGDIKTSYQPCDEHHYADTAALLKTLQSPVFIIPGDNEVNDCADPAAGWAFWKKHFGDFEKNWPVRFSVKRQDKRPENFSFIRKRVLFIGLHLGDGKINDRADWNTRLRHNAEWVENLFSKYGSSVRGAVLFAHASGVRTFRGKSIGKQALFTNRFRKAARAFGKPVLYLQGDGHVWIKDKPWPEKNILRVQVAQGGTAEPLKVKISEGPGTDLFIFE